MPDELPIPPDALTHRSVEMIRAWLANEQLHVVLNVGFWQEREEDERAAWGILLADTVRHLGDALQSEYGFDADESVTLILKSMAAEILKPSSERLGDFVIEKRDMS